MLTFGPFEIVSASILFERDRIPAYINAKRVAFCATSDLN